MFHIALRKNGRTVKKMGDYDTQAAAASDARAFVDSGVVPSGVSVLVCDGSSARAPTKRKNPFKTMAGVRAANKAAGGKWFDRGASKFFGTRIVGGPYGGHYFVTAETDPGGKTAYTVRRAADDGKIHTVGDFHSYARKDDAVAVAKSLGKDAAKVRKTAAVKNPGARKNPGPGDFRLVQVGSKWGVYDGYSRVTVRTGSKTAMMKLLHELKEPRHNPAAKKGALVTYRWGPTGGRGIYQGRGSDPGSAIIHTTSGEAPLVITARKGEWEIVKKNPTVLGHKVSKTKTGYKVDAYGKTFKSKKATTKWLQGHIAREK